MLYILIWVVGVIGTLGATCTSVPSDLSPANLRILYIYIHIRIQMYNASLFSSDGSDDELRNWPCLVVAPPKRSIDGIGVISVSDSQFIRQLSRVCQQSVWFTT